MKTTLLLLLLFWSLIYLPSTTFASESQHSVEPQGIHWSEIKSWKPLGLFWEGALNERGELIGIYDLSYPNLNHPVRLGSIQPNRSSILSLAESIKASEGSNWSAEQKAYAVQALENLSRSSQLNEDINPGAALSEQATLLSQGWWHSIPWKKRQLAFAREAPAHFRLSDIDFARIANQPEDFNSTLALLGPTLLKSIHYIRNEAGGYDLFWKPTSPPRAQAQEQLLKPFLLLNLKHPKSQLGQALAWDALINLIPALVNQIPVPIAAGLLSAGLAEYFQQITELQFLHLEMALEMIRAARFDSEPSAFSSLTDHQLKRALEAFYFAESTLLTAWRWIWTSPEKAWMKWENSSLQLSVKSKDWLENHSTRLTPIHPYFALGTDEQEHKRLYLLSLFHLPTFSPPVGLDYSHPHRIRDTRIALETSNVLVNFLTNFIPIPFLGGALSTLYKAAVIVPMHQAQYWEARLESFLFHRMLMENENWSYEIELLHAQKINAFEASPSEMRELIHTRRNALRPRSTPSIDDPSD